MSTSIIEPVPLGTPTMWCLHMIIVAKKNGQPRRTVDSQVMNKYYLRETNYTPSPFNLAQSVPVGTRKTNLDASNGYHTVPDTDSEKPPHSLRNLDYIAMLKQPKATSQLVMLALADLKKLSVMSLGGSNAKTYWNDTLSTAFTASTLESSMRWSLLF